MTKQLSVEVVIKIVTELQDKHQYLLYIKNNIFNAWQKSVKHWWKGNPFSTVKYQIHTICQISVLKRILFCNFIVLLGVKCTTIIYKLFYIIYCPAVYYDVICGTPFAVLPVTVTTMHAVSVHCNINFLDNIQSIKVSSIFSASSKCVPY